MIKLLEENIGSNLLDTGLGNDSNTKNKSKNKQVRLHQTEKLPHSKGNHQQNKLAVWEQEKISANLHSVMG